MKVFALGETDSTYKKMRHCISSFIITIMLSLGRDLIRK
jgi:hypothetical protein